MNGEPTKKQRAVRVFPDTASWLLEIEDDWDSMTEDQRQEYIYESACDCGKIGAFTYREVTRER